MTHQAPSLFDARIAVPALSDAFKKLDMVEHSARILWLAHAVGHAKPLPAEYVAKLLATREQLGIRTTNTLENQCGLPRRST